MSELWRALSDWFGRSDSWATRVLVPVLTAVWLYVWHVRPQRAYAQALKQAAARAPRNDTTRTGASAGAAAADAAVGAAGDGIDLNAKRRVSYRFDSGEALHITEHRSGRPLGTVVWDGAVVLCWYLSDAPRRGRWRGKRVLELGAGTGLVGLRAAQLGASAHLTDLPMLLPLLRDNIALNAAAIANADSDAKADARADADVATAATAAAAAGVSLFAGVSSSTAAAAGAAPPLRATAGALEWGPDAVARDAAPYDVVVGADVLYVDEHVFVALLHTLLALTAADAHASAGTAAAPRTVVLLSGARRHTYEQQYLTRLRAHFAVTELDAALRGITARIDAAQRAGTTDPALRLRNPTSACYILQLTRLPASATASASATATAITAGAVHTSE